MSKILLSFLCFLYLNSFMLWSAYSFYIYHIYYGLLSNKVFLFFFGSHYVHRNISFERRTWFLLPSFLWIFNIFSCQVHHLCCRQCHLFEHAVGFFTSFVWFTSSVEKKYTNWIWHCNIFPCCLLILSHLQIYSVNKNLFWVNFSWLYRQQS